MGAARDAAYQIRFWAIKNKLIDASKLERPISDTESTEFPSDRLLPAEALDIIHTRRINFIGFNDASSEVIVFTHRQVTKKEKKALPESTPDGIKIVYEQGNTPTIGGAPAVPHAVPPYALRGRRYTCGSSIYVGNRVGAGTLGCLVRNADGQLFGLSNNHVTGGCNFSDPGLPIIAPGPIDVRPAGCDPFTLGYHNSLKPMVDGTPENVRVQDNTDAAVLRIKDPDSVSSFQRDCYDSPSVSDQISAGQIVEKVGRTTGYTAGFVRAQIAGPEPVAYSIPELDIKKYVFYDPMFVVTGNSGLFSDFGDSGSLVVTRDNQETSQKAVGIVVAGNSAGGLSFVLPIGPILDHFSVQLVANHNV